MLFNIIADSVEDNAELAAQAANVAHRIQNRILDAIGINGMLPTPIKDLNDKVYGNREPCARIWVLDFRIFAKCRDLDTEPWPDDRPGGYSMDRVLYPSRPGAKAAKKPPTRVEKHAHQHTAPSYKTLEEHGTEKALIHCLDSGFPVMFGMKTYNYGLLRNIESNGRGLRNPTAKEMKNEHRHSLLAVSYNQLQAEKVFIVRNSWGAHWGEGGYFCMPYYYLKYCYDFWTMRLVISHPEKN